jgi:hypothetical protein
VVFSASIGGFDAKNISGRLIKKNDLFGERSKFVWLYDGKTLLEKLRLHINSRTADTNENKGNCEF